MYYFVKKKNHNKPPSPPWPSTIHCEHCDFSNVHCNLANTCVLNSGYIIHGFALLQSFNLQTCKYLEPTSKKLIFTFQYFSLNSL